MFPWPLPPVDPNKVQQIGLAPGKSAPAGGGSTPPSSLLTGLNRYYAFSVSAFLTDSSGNANTLTNHGATQGGSGIIGDCAQLVAASSQWLEGPNFSTTPASSFTFAFWLNPTSLASNANSVPAFLYDDGSSGVFIQIVDGSGHMKSQFITSAGAVTSQDNVHALSASAWNLVVIYFDLANNKVGLQINNNTPVETSLGGGTLLSVVAFFILGKFEGGFFYDGGMDEVGFWNVVLTPTQRASLWNSGAGVTYPFTGVP